MLQEKDLWLDCGEGYDIICVNCWMQMYIVFSLSVCVLFIQLFSAMMNQEMGFFDTNRSANLNYHNLFLFFC